MIGLDSLVRIWLCTGPTDMRKSFRGLGALVRSPAQSRSAQRLESDQRKLSWVILELATLPITALPGAHEKSGLTPSKSFIK